MVELITTPLTTFGAACTSKGIGILPPWYKYLTKGEDSSGKCGISFAFPEDVGAIVLALIEILLRLGVYVAVAYIIYGGFIYLTSQGEPDRAKAAQQTISNAIIGLIIAILATGVVAFIGRQFVS